MWLASQKNGKRRSWDKKKVQSCWSGPKRYCLSKIRKLFTMNTFVSEIFSKKKSYSCF